MEQQPSPQPKHHVRRFGVISLIVLALVVIASSAFILLNPNGLETTDDEQNGVATIGETSISPSVLKVDQGESVTWDNTSTKARQLVITSSDPQQDLEGFGSDEAIMQGESYSFTFDKKGSFTYEDSADPDKIKGTIIVE